MKKLLLLLGVLFSVISYQISGQTWSTLKRLTWNSGGSYGPSIAANLADWIHVVWYDITPGNMEIFYKHSLDNGTTWSGPTRLTWNAGHSREPSIANDSSNWIHVVWHDETPGNSEIFYKRSTNSGGTWSALKRLTWNSGRSSESSIAADSGGRIHVVWQDDTPGNKEIFYKRSPNSGITWFGVRRMTWNVGPSSSPSIAADSGTGIHVVWCNEITDELLQIFYKRSTDNGTTWSGPARLTWNTDDAFSPFLSTDSGNGIHVAWVDQSSGNNEIFYKRSTDSGNTWSVTKRLSWNTGWSSAPSVISDLGSGIHVVWHDNTPGNEEVFYKRSTDSGAVWSGLTRLTWNSYKSYYPNLAVGSGSRIHVVWYETTSGASEIFYKNGK